ncbi:O-antigen ligase family protein [Clostridium sp. Cult3]|uniref:O-antigen ligase family protein n=1 Tax=Clostridium sp. Cult3 TaxID=2079004 RepID=UPI001F398F4F|nr:O-antigen ligase family protein [Clostridium sp. Cult3]MCF6460860.1 hypothetical protein [Clostridium sp. Cult3]
MNIDKNKDSMGCKKVFPTILSLLFLIPYLEVEKIRSIFTYYHPGENNLIPSIIIVMLIIIVILSPLLFVSTIKKTGRIDTYFISILLARTAFDFITLIRIIFSSKPIDILFQYFWCEVPFYFAFFVLYVINRLNVDISKIHLNAIYFFTIYLILNIFINISRYEYVFGNIKLGARNRLISPGGGPVILGYTIAIMFSLFLFYQHKIKKQRFTVMFFIMLMASFFTGSRGSMWMITFLVILYLIDKRKLGIVGLIIVLISFLYVNPIEFLNEKVPRFFNLTDESRISTVLNTIDIFSKQSTFGLLFGKGLGVFFPYQDWFLSKTPGMNYFIYEGNVLLVQPHNSYIYLLIETGIFGLILFVYPLYKAFRILPKAKDIMNWKYAVCTIFLIVFLNCFDSVFVIAPGSAALWWLIILSLSKYLYDYSIKKEHIETNNYN